ncbi:unnamed protein product [Hydatigera taeniaeformis]|uniref:C2 domain-containing protein n=1 Tax=Hydatigena taeniaeformis TaxID=6205 RepID=A0A0R3X597_HYDTA|nr:unnamed protein product [Hydatigera taeniaeformis]
MPATVKVKVLAARNLPVMDRTSFLTDAFVEVRFFAHDAIGRVYLDLTPLLQTDQKPTLNGWFPLYDTMHGIRGEINLTVRVDLFPDACRQRFSSLGVQFFFSSSIPSGYRVVSLIGFVRELVMNDDPEHQWIEKIRTSRASNEARQCLFSQLSGNGHNFESILLYRLHFDLEGDTGIVARAIGTAARLQRFPPNNQLGISLTGKRDSEMGSKAPARSENDARGHADNPIGGYALSSPKPLNDAEFPFLTISHPPRELIRHFGSTVVAKSVKLLDKGVTDRSIKDFPAILPLGSVFSSVAETANSRAAWWLELRMEALTRMYNVGCDALIGYCEECAIYEDICVLSVSATAVTLNQLWVHFSYIPGPSSRLPSRSFSSRQGWCIFSTLLELSSNFISCSKMPRVALESPGRDEAVVQSKREHVINPSSDLSVSLNPQGDKGESHSTYPNHNCSVCHIPTLNQALPPNKSSRCRVCRVAFVPEFLLSTTDFPPELPIVGRPAFIQVGLSRSKKVEKGESAAREISELLPYIEYELHYRLLQKLRLRGMNAIFRLSLQLAIGEDLIVVLATGTGVYVPALPSARLPKVCPVSGNLNTLHAEILYNLRAFNEECHELFGIPKDIHESVPAEWGNGHSSSLESLEGESKEVRDGEISMAGAIKGKLIYNPTDPVSNEKDHSEHTSTYFVDAREPEPEELNSLLSDPLPPPGLIATTTDFLPSNESFSWLVTIKHEQGNCVSNTCSWRRLHSFVKVHTIQTLKTDDALGSIPLRYPPSGSLGGDISLPILHSSSSFDSTLNVPSADKCMTKCLRDCNQLTWFHFRCIMPCAITSLRYRLTIVDDDVVQIICSGVALSPSNDEPVSLKNISSVVPAKPEGQKSSVSNPRKSLFNRPKGLRAVPMMELKTASQTSESENFSDQSTAKNSSKKTRWWKPFSKDSSTTRLEASNSTEFPDGLNYHPNLQNESDTFEGKCILTPSPDIRNCEVTHYLGNYSFFFVRETNDLREMGGLRCFIHAAVMEAQAVAAAHTVGLGGNALLSYQISDLLITRPTSRNQAQCLINLRGDMARINAN